MEVNKAQYKELAKQRLQVEVERRNLFCLVINGSLELAQKHNLARLAELANHSAVIGNRELLDTFVLTPVKEGRSCLRPEDIGAYCYALDSRANLDSVTEQEKVYLRILINELQLLDERT